MLFSQGNLQIYKVQPTSRLRIVAVILFALAYATILANLPLLEFQDRDYYLQYARASDVIFERYQSRGISSIIFNEPIWLLINVTLRSVLEPELIVRTVIFVGAFLTAYTFLRLSAQNIVILILFLLIPQVLKNHISHLRQGLGLSIFMSGMLFSDWRRLTLMGLAPFVHSSFFFIIVLTQVDRIIKLFINFSIEVKMLLLFITSIIFSSNLQAVLAAAGDRRAAYYGAGTAETSGLGWLFWSLILVLILTSGKHWLNKYSFSIYALVFYLTTYFLIEVTARIFESSMCLVLLACLNLKGLRIYVFLSAMTIYGLFQWSQRLNSTPMF